MDRHEIPTHLNVEDKAFYGLSVRQVMHLMGGAAGAYTLWGQWPDAPIALRVLAAGACLAMALVFALVRPYGRDLEGWLFLALRYAAFPRACVWRPSEPHPEASAPAGSRRQGWAELLPNQLGGATGRAARRGRDR